MDGNGRNLYSQFKPDEAPARRKLAHAIIFLAGKLKSRSRGRKGGWAGGVGACAKAQRGWKLGIPFRLTSLADIQTWSIRAERESPHEGDRVASGTFSGIISSRLAA